MDKQRDYYVNVSEVMAPGVTLETAHGYKIKSTVTGKMYATFDSPLTTCGKKSVNGLEVSVEEMKWAISQPLVTERLRNKAFWCCLDHPDPSDDYKFKNVLQADAAFRINEFGFKKDSEGYDVMYGNIDTLPNEKGNTLLAMIEMGANVAFSQRGGYRITQVDGKPFKQIRMAGYDAVWIPSNRESWSTSDIRNITESIRDVPYGVSKGNIEMFAKTSMNHLNGGGLTRAIAEHLNGSDDMLKLCTMEVMPASIKEQIVDIAESVGDGLFKPTHILVTRDGSRRIGYATERMTVEARMSESAYGDHVRMLKKILG